MYIRLVGGAYRGFVPSDVKLSILQHVKKVSQCEFAIDLRRLCKNIGKMLRTSDEPLIQLGKVERA